MRLTEVLTPERVLVDRAGADLQDKDSALRRLASLLAGPGKAPEESVHALLEERERVQSTGIGDGVAIPHAFLDEAVGQAAALLVCPRGIAFDAIDSAPVGIVFGVIGPRNETGAHLRMLARISRLLRNADTRQRLLAAPDPAEAFRLVAERDEALG